MQENDEVIDHNDYRQGIRFFTAQAVVLNQPPPDIVHYNPGDGKKNWLLSLCDLLASLLREMEPILFKQGEYRRPNIFRFISVGRIALKLILGIIKLIKK